MSTSSKTMEGFIIQLLCKLASMNDVGGVYAVTTMPQYRNSMGREAIGIAMAWGHNDVIYEILSRPNAWEEYKANQFSPFVVLDKMEASLSKYKPYAQDR